MCSLDTSSNDALMHSLDKSAGFAALSDAVSSKKDFARQVSGLLSQGSTTPSTPGLDLLDEPVNDFVFQPLVSCDESDTSAEIDDDSDKTVETEEGEAAFRLDNEGFDDEPRLCTGIPPLESELGKWAQWAVANEAWQAANRDEEGAETQVLDCHAEVEEEQVEEVEESHPRLCAGMPPLQSELGRWAQWAVTNEDWQAATLGHAEKYVFQRDVEFSSPSESSMILENESVEALADGDESVAESEIFDCHAASDDEHVAEACDHQPSLCVALPPLESDLAKWAQWAVAAEAWQTSVLGSPVHYTWVGACDQHDSEWADAIDGGNDSAPGGTLQLEEASEDQVEPSTSSAAIREHGTLQWIRDAFASAEFHRTCLRFA